MDISGPANKIVRAHQHFSYLQELIHEYLDSKPYQIEVLAIPEDFRYVVTARHAPPPREIGLVFGDVVHNLRSALDHYARLMVLDSGGTPKDGGGGTTFPILRRRPPNGPSVVGGISDERLAILDKIQPYELGERFADHPLWRLSELDNIDKHREVQLVAMHGIASVVFVPAAETEIILSPDCTRYPISLESPLPQHVQVEAEDFYSDARATGMFTTAVKFADDEFCGGQQLYILCLQFFAAVEDMIAQFASLSSDNSDGFPE